MFTSENERENSIFTKLYEPYTKVELMLFGFIQAIISKTNWKKKLINKTILTSWLEEAKVMDFEDTAIQYMLDRLNYEINHNEYSMVSAFHKIFQTDELVDEKLKQSLLKELKVLEDIPSENRDYHPFSQNQVINLVHPSLFCLVSDRSLITEKLQQRNVEMSKWVGLGETYKYTGPSAGLDFDRSDSSDPNDLAVPEDYFFSKFFQWLPSDVQVSKEGKVTFESYINNIHPIQHKKLYKTLEDILELFIPIFEKVLGYNEPQIINQEYHRQLKEHYNYLYNITGDECIDEEDKLPTMFKEVFKKPANDNRFNLKGRNLQVITKLANIELTPKNPKFRGGKWHMEGMKNESIVATGIYYYSVENITQSDLMFRHAVEQPYDLPTDWGSIFDLQSDSELSQDLGHLTALEDRCIAFPNQYQHCIAPFQLEDPTKNGHRKILVFFLVDPSNEIISTSRVPPQQKDWILPIYMNVFSQLFPKEITEQIVEFLPSVMSMDEAKKYRLDLMEERGDKVKDQEGNVFHRRCTLCEH